MIKPARIQTEKWDRFYLELAEFVATKLSKDPSTKVGAVLANYEYGLEFFGYNGFPPGVNDDPERYNNRELKYAMVNHAERCALAKAGQYARGGVLYVWPSFSLPPICNECAKAALNAGIKEIVGYLPDESDPRVQRWKDSIAISKLMFDEAGIGYRGLTQ